MPQTLFQLLRAVPEELLVEFVDTPDKFGWSPLHLISNNMKLRVNDARCIIQQLARGKAVAEARRDISNATPLVTACGSGAIAQAKQFVIEGACPEAESRDGNTVADYVWHNIELRDALAAVDSRRGKGVTGTGRLLCSCLRRDARHAFILTCLRCTERLAFICVKSSSPCGGKPTCNATNWFSCCSDASRNAHVLLRSCYGRGRSLALIAWPRRRGTSGGRPGRVTITRGNGVDEMRR